MRLTVLLALVAGVSASTPSGFQPSNSDDLIVTFGSKLATNGANIARSDTSKAPSVYTSAHKDGYFYLLLVDPDASGGVLQWLQAFQSSTTSTTIPGTDAPVFALTSNSSAAVADYEQPSPPFKVPYTHRYVALLLDASHIEGIGDESLQADAQTRSPFDWANVIKTAGVPIVGSTWFNVTNEQALASGSASGGATSHVTSASSVSPVTATGSGSGSTSAATTASGSGTPTTASSSPSPSSTKNAAAGLRWDAALAVGVAAVAFARLL